MQYRAAVAGAVLLTNDGQLPWPSEPGMVAVIGPYADVGRPQGGGSARVRPDHVTPIIAALNDRGVRTVYAQGCSIERFHPPLPGPIEMVITDDAGKVHTETTGGTMAFWQEEPAPALSRRFGAVMTTSFTPETSGVWTLGARSVGECIVSVDGVEVLRIDRDDRGGSFFDYGSPERVADVELVADVAVDVRIDYPIDDHPGIRALAVGLRPPTGSDPVAHAVEVAAAADRVLLVVGTDDDWETESRDRDDMDLPGRQSELIAAVASANSNTTVVLNAGSPVTMDWRHDVSAVMQVWFPGGEIGAAVADLVTGAAAPGGRLPVTIPERLASVIPPRRRTIRAPMTACRMPRDARSVTAGTATMMWRRRSGLAMALPMARHRGANRLSAARSAMSLRSRCRSPTRLTVRYARWCRSTPWHRISMTSHPSDSWHPRWWTSRRAPRQSRWCGYRRGALPYGSMVNSVCRRAPMRSTSGVMRAIHGSPRAWMWPTPLCSATTRGDHCVDLGGIETDHGVDAEPTGYGQHRREGAVHALRAR
ncbi:MAG: hypothetical protein EBS20_09355 [Actinobacteria bacterium]|nr:hypothetical protein [Actinomycetota bacterium]